MDNCNAEKGKNQVFDPFVNTGVAVMLDSERKKICGVMGDSGSPEDIECCVDLARCPYNFLEFANTGGSEWALKYVARAMRGWKEPEPEGVRDFGKEAENEQI